jgi:hypothetical protein
MDLLRKRSTDSKPLDTTDSSSQDFAWPPPPSAGEVIYLDSEPNRASNEPQYGLEAEESLQAPQLDYVWVEHLLAKGMRFEWYDAVAILLQLIDQLAPADGQEPEGSFPTVDRIALEPSGTLSARLEPEGTPLVSLGQLLLQLLAGRDTPAALRLLAMQAASPAPNLLFVSDFRRELERWERPQRRQGLIALYEQAKQHLSNPSAPLSFPARTSSAAPHAMTPHSSPSAPATVTPHDKEPIGARRRSRKPSLWALVAVTAGSISGAAVAVVYLTRAASSVLGLPDATASTPAANIELPAPDTPSVVERATGGARAPAATPAPPRSTNTAAPAAPAPTSAASTGREARGTSASSVPIGQPEALENPNPSAAVPLQGPARAGSSPAISQGMSLVPTEVQDTFARARQLFDKQQYADAADGFVAVVKMLEREDPAFDLRWTANEFAAVSRVLASQSGGQAERIYVSTDADVTEPVALGSSLPPAVQPGTRPQQLAMLELIIDGQGTVESARYIGPAQHYRDRWWISAAKAWLFKPATRNGTPVKFLKRIVFVDGAASDPP